MTTNIIVYRLTKSMLFWYAAAPFNRARARQATAKFKEILALIAQLQSILDNFDQLMQIIKDELIQIRDDFGDARKTQIVDSRRTLVVQIWFLNRPLCWLFHARAMPKNQPISDYIAQNAG